MGRGGPLAAGTADETVSNRRLLCFPAFLRPDTGLFGGKERRPGLLFQRFTSAVLIMEDPTHPSLPNSDPAPPVPASVAPEDDAPDEASPNDDLSHLPPEYRAAVRRLRARVDWATTALDRLQAENERLRRRVAELEQRPAVHSDTTTLVLDDAPDALRGRISAFIEAIDAYLENGADGAPRAPSPSESS